MQRVWTYTHFLLGLDNANRIFNNCVFHYKWVIRPFSGFGQDRCVNITLLIQIAGSCVRRRNADLETVFEVTIVITE